MRCCLSTVAARSAQAFCDKRPPPRLFHHRLRTRVLATTADGACIVDGDPGDLVAHSTAAKTVQPPPTPGNNLSSHCLRSFHKSLCRERSHSALIRPPTPSADRLTAEIAGVGLAGRPSSTGGANPTWRKRRVQGTYTSTSHQATGRKLRRSCHRWSQDTVLDPPICQRYSLEGES